MKLVILSIFSWVCGTSSIRLPVELAEKSKSVELAEKSRATANWTWTGGAEAKDLAVLSEAAQQNECLKKGCANIPHVWAKVCCQWCIGLGGSPWWNCGSLSAANVGKEVGTRGTMYIYHTDDVTCAKPAMKMSFFSEDHNLLGNQMKGPETCYKYTVSTADAQAAGAKNSQNVVAINQHAAELSARIWCKKSTMSLFIGIWKGSDCAGKLHQLHPHNMQAPYDESMEHWLTHRFTDFAVQGTGHAANTCEADKEMMKYADDRHIVGSNFQWPNCEFECNMNTKLCAYQSEQSQGAVHMQANR